MHPIDTAFGKRLRRLREDAGFSQADLAERLALPQAGVSRLESGARGAKLPELYALASLLRLSVAEILAEGPVRHSAPLAVPTVSLDEALSMLSAHGVRFLGKPVTPTVLKPSLAAAILAALSHAQEPRLFEALPELLRRSEAALDWEALIGAAVSRRLQNRLGGALAGALHKEKSPILQAALERLVPWRLDHPEFLGPAPRTPEGREMLAHRTPAWLKAWHLIGVPSLK